MKQPYEIYSDGRYTYIYTVEINRPDSTWTEVNATVYSQSGVPLLSSNEKQKPVKIEKDTIHILFCIVSFLFIK